MTKKHKILLTVLLLLSALIFSGFVISKQKGKNSLKNKIISISQLTALKISVEAEHDWYELVDFFGGASNNSELGWVSDIHADIYKRRTVESGTLYPRQFSVYLPKVFDELRKKKINTVIATGDNTNSGDADYGRELAQLAYRKNMKVLWVNGNHDKAPGMEALGMKDPNRYYYFQDFGNTRVIVLDDAQAQFGGWIDGGIGPDEINWLRETIKTDKQVVVAMHIPVFPLSLEDSIVPNFEELDKIFHESGNVKLVLTGHFHTRWNKQYKGIQYFGQSALTRENEEGGYGIIDLNNMTVNNSYAK